MTFQESVQTCVAKKYADFTGDATRSELWWFLLFVFALTTLLENLNRGVSGIFALSMLVPSAAAAVRRLHDTSRSGLWLLLWLLPVVGNLVVIYLLVQPGRSPTTPT